MSKRPRYFALADDCVGSDQYFPCDGRWNLYTCVQKAREHYRKNTPNGYAFSFKIYTGTILNAKAVTGSYRIYSKN